MTAIPRIAVGRWLVEMLVPPADCGQFCPCSVGLSDVSEYGWDYEHPIAVDAPFSWLGPVGGES